MKKYVIWIFLGCITSNWAQERVQLNYYTEELPLDSVQPLSIDHHTAIHPQFSFQSAQTKKSYLGYSKSFTGENFLGIHALTDNLFSAENNQYRTGIGALIESQFANKIYARFSLIEGKGKVDNAFLSPKSYRFSNQDSSIHYTDIRGRISYSPNSIFNFQAGIDQQFIGEGNRSVLLSDYSVPAPFAQIRTKFWRLEYVMLYQFYREKVKSDWKSKYATTHYLSVNATKWLNFGLFETVVFMPQDTTLNRGYDPEYLNPMVFFRPQEYAMGSSDNIIMGVHLSVKYKEHTFYSQFALDEFLLSEIRKKSKWWGNKYAGQVGIKGRFLSEKGLVFYRAELNFARPYTYSHSTYMECYGNQGYALAHPLGASFAELLGELKWQKKNWLVKGLLNYSLQGKDTIGGSFYGNNIYNSYNIRPYEYGWKIGAGKGNNQAHLMITVAYLLDKRTNLQVFLENHLRSNTYIKQPTYQFVLGLRSVLWNDYRNY